MIGPSGLADRARGDFRDPPRLQVERIRNRTIRYLRDPRVEGDLSTGPVALRGTGTGWLLSDGRFGCGGDRLQSRQVPA